MNANSSRRTKPTYRPDVIQESPAQYAVNSASDVTKWYTVQTDEQGVPLFCGCKDHEKRHSFCKHMHAVSAFIAVEIAEAVIAQRALRRTPTFQKCPHCPADYWGLAAEGAWCTCRGAVAAREMPSNVLPESRLSEKRDAVALLLECYGQ